LPEPRRGRGRDSGAGLPIGDVPAFDRIHRPVPPSDGCRCQNCQHAHADNQHPTGADQYGPRRVDNLDAAQAEYGSRHPDDHTCSQPDQYGSRHADNYRHPGLDQYGSRHANDDCDQHGSRHADNCTSLRSDQYGTCRADDHVSNGYVSGGYVSGGYVSGDPDRASDDHHQAHDDYYGPTPYHECPRA
jgi:hypothetical protein